MSLQKSVDNLDLALERQRAGVRAYEVASELGVSPSVVSNFENGRRDTLPEGRGRSEYRGALAAVVARGRRGDAA